MKYEMVEVNYNETIATITLGCTEKRNALSLKHMQEITAAFIEVGESEARGVILAATGPVFCSGHDFADMGGQNLVAMRKLLKVCTVMMDTIQQIPQPVVARVQGLATGAGCQLVSTCDLAVASEKAAFAVPGGKGGWFCTTPGVALSRNISRKRVLEMLFTGEAIEARTALEWGLVNRVVPEEKLEEETYRLITAATRGSKDAKGLGKQAFYGHIDLDQAKAYALAIEVMASSSQIPDAQERINAFLEKRKPNFKK